MSRALAAATITTTPVALARTAAISRGMSPSTILLVPVALGRTTAHALGLSPATIAVTAVTAAVLAGAPGSIILPLAVVMIVVEGQVLAIGPAVVTLGSAHYAVNVDDRDAASVSAGGRDEFAITLDDHANAGVTLDVRTPEYALSVSNVES